MKKTLILASFTALAMPSLSAQELNRPSASTRLEATVGLTGEKVQSDLNKTSSVGFFVSFAGEHTLLTDLKLKARARALLETGSSESVYESNPYEPTSRLSLGEAFLEYTPWSFLTLQGGAISGGVHENELFMSKSPFLGAREAMSFNPGSFVIGLAAFQGIPDNHNLAQRLGKVEEGEPRFFNETLSFEWHPETFSLRAHVSHWAYSGLSTGVAYESRFLGNSISGLGKENSRFMNTFKGFEGMLSLSTIVYKNYELGVSYWAHQNSEARDKTKDTGHLVAPYASILYAPGITTLTLLSYRLEADSIPAYYSSLKFGGTNKKGTGIELEWKTIDESFSVAGRFMRNEEIDPSSFQADEDLIVLELRRIYDIF